MNVRRGIFFDLDGTLVDNEHLKARAFAEAMEAFGGKSHPSIYQEVMGMSGAVIMKRFADRAGIQVDLEAYAQAYKVRYGALLKGDLAVRPGAVRFLAAAKERGLHLALVSGASSIFVSQIVHALKLGEFFDFVISGEDVARKKPDPACYQLAMAKMGVRNDWVLVFEDSEAGLRAARGAGIATICMRHGYNQSHDLSEAVSQYDSFEDGFDNICKDVNLIFRAGIF